MLEDQALIVSETDDPHGQTIMTLAKPIASSSDGSNRVIGYNAAGAVELSGSGCWREAQVRSGNG